MSAIAFIVAVFLPETSSFLQYQHDFAQSGEVWRLVSAHFVHLDWPHFLLNLLGLWLLWLLVGKAFNMDQWLLLIVLLSVSITMGLRIWSPEVDWYVGLSGLLYGMLAIGLVMRIQNLKSPLTFLFFLVLLKAFLDSFFGPLTLIDLTEHRVVSDAHVYGIVSGTGFGLIGRIMLFQRNKKPGPFGPGSLSESGRDGRI
ncbi:rhombosortase [Marinobacter salinus]|uniref:rhombosortase n=1 Tax=Marinobacter salinus TaxID=1874317 RepID=UPI0009F4C2E5|nr:rhombosortase [Marinobacter salinus]